MSLYHLILIQHNGSDFIPHLDTEEIRLHIFYLPKEYKLESSKMRIWNLVFQFQLRSFFPILVTQYIERIKRWILESNRTGLAPAFGTAWSCAHGQVIFFYETRLWIKLKIVIPHPTLTTHTMGLWEGLNGIMHEKHIAERSINVSHCYVIM